jgi:membrane fusion protein (multidrug efflux system)
MKNHILLGLAVLTVFTQPVLAQGKLRGAPKATPVIVSTVYNDKFVDTVEAIGTLRANETITLAATVTDTVTAVNFTDGQRVSKGDILVEMTSGEEKALLDQQKALVNEAQKQLNRTRDLARSGAAASSVLDERQREYTAAKAGLAALQSRLENYIIVAPFDGIVGLRNVSPGALLQPGMKITTLDDDSVMKLDFSVPSVFLQTLKPGVEIIASATGFKEEFKGDVSAIDSQIDEATRSVIVRAVIPNPDGKLKPGLLMTVKLLKNPRDVAVIPETAIVPEGRKHFVLVVGDDNIVEKREIIIGARRPGDVEVVDKLKVGEKVVVQGTMMAQDGKAVQISAEQKKGESLQDLLKRLKAEKKPAEEKGK